MSALRVVWIVLVAAPVINLAAGRTSWPYIAWAAVSIPAGLVVLGLIGRRNAEKSAPAVPEGHDEGASSHLSGG